MDPDLLAATRYENADPATRSDVAANRRATTLVLVLSERALMPAPVTCVKKVARG